MSVAQDAAPGRPRLHRDTPISTWGTSSTQQGLPVVSGGRPISDLLEAVVDLATLDPAWGAALTAHAYAVGERNRKRPSLSATCPVEVSHGAETSSLDVGRAGGAFDAQLHAALRETVGDAHYQADLVHVSFARTSETGLLASAPNAFCAALLEDKYHEVIEELAAQLLGHGVDLALEVTRQTEPPVPVASAPPVLPPAPSAPATEPETQEELSALLDQEELLLLEERKREDARVQQLPVIVDHKPAHERLAQIRAIEDRQRAADNKRRRDALTARTLYSLTTPPHHVDHHHLHREAGATGPSAFEVDTRSTQASALRALRPSEKRRPKPDTS